jgi:hypothetical protein
MKTINLTITVITIKVTQISGLGFNGSVSNFQYFSHYESTKFLKTFKWLYTLDSTE